MARLADPGPYKRIRSSDRIALFPHIPKAGGGTIKEGFYQVFGRQQCLKVWNPSFGADVGPRKFIRLEKEDFSNIRAVVGHLTVGQFTANQYMKELWEMGSVCILASVRDPIERLISLYNYICLYTMHPKHAIVSTMSLEEFILKEPLNVQFS